MTRKQFRSLQIIIVALMGVLTGTTFIMIARDATTLIFGSFINFSSGFLIAEQVRKNRFEKKVRRDIQRTIISRPSKQ